MLHPASLTLNSAILPYPPHPVPVPPADSPARPQSQARPCPPAPAAASPQSAPLPPRCFGLPARLQIFSIRGRRLTFNIRLPGSGNRRARPGLAAHPRSFGLVRSMSPRWGLGRGGAAWAINMPSRRDWARPPGAPPPIRRRRHLRSPAGAKDNSPSEARAPAWDTAPKKSISLSPSDGERAGVRGQPPAASATNIACPEPAPDLYPSQQARTMNAKTDNVIQSGQEASPSSSRNSCQFRERRERSTVISGGGGRPRRPL